MTFEEIKHEVEAIDVAFDCTDPTTKAGGRARLRKLETELFRLKNIVRRLRGEIGIHTKEVNYDLKRMQNIADEESRDVGF